ncbi:membrane-associated zinc metalloprotease [Thermaerobacter marianensis DSM 12885]|uniref:Zinc metalloprotease n=1 Tax=Thermaerobacter marianensis (strain ATCC 700841 / DSM 12885 / JCM 10246 / 7p75a) TaxID=644966 RepID=E6SJR1_THEM7|nr:RIP metalloprotease RseP [Thermaerobacter marianensis]ADU51124.1 membrane-associated zinc metalloprotease [Thermaerobacter marianensis DSM 12885]
MVVWTIAVFALLIVIHELGHFWAAKRSGVLVHEFALGFGPRLAYVRRGETEYSLRLLPLGGFVRMAGMQPDEEGLEDVPPPRRFLGRPLGDRLKIIAAGPVMNVVLAVVLFTLVFAVIGVPVARPVVGEVVAGYPAAEAGLRPGDRIVAIDGQPVESWEQVVEGIQGAGQRPVEITVRRGEATLTVRVTPRPDPQRPGVGVVGIRPQVETARTGVVEAVVRGAQATYQVAAGFVLALVHLITGQGGFDIIGPVGIGRQIGEAARVGLSQVVLLAAVLSANLALVNLLPIPALDGGRLLFLAVEAVRGRPVDPEQENLIHFVGFALLMLLAIVITYRDLLRLNAS